MQVPINYLQERFPVFGYSTLQKYKADKESKSFFESKKDFYLFLEANYLLELKARKNLMKILDFKDIYFLSKLDYIENYIYEPNPIKSLIKDFKNLKQDSFIYFPELILEIIKHVQNNAIDSKDEINKNVNQIVKNFNKKYKKQEIIENFEKKILSKNLNYFDYWVIIEMIINVKKYTELLEKGKGVINYETLKQINSVEFETNNNVLEISTINPNNKEEIFFLEYNKKTNKIIIREKIDFNRNKSKDKEVSKDKKLRTKKLEEPKWIYFSNDNVDLYLDHLFNFIEINYEDKYFQYNSLRIPLDTFLNSSSISQNVEKKGTTPKKIRRVIL